MTRVGERLGEWLGEWLGWEVRGDHDCGELRATQKASVCTRCLCACGVDQKDAFGLHWQSPSLRP